MKSPLDIERIFSSIPRLHEVELQKFLNGFADGDVWFGEALRDYVPGTRFKEMGHLEFWATPCAGCKLIYLVTALYEMLDYVANADDRTEETDEFYVEFMEGPLVPTYGANDVAFMTTAEQACLIKDIFLEVAAVTKNARLRTAATKAAKSWQGLLNRPTFYRLEYCGVEYECDP